MNKKKPQTIILIAAGIVLALALIWALTRGAHSELGAIADRINELGYHFISDDLLIAYDDADTTISEALDKDEASLKDIIAESKEYGFNSDINKRGGVTLILARENAIIVACYLIDGEIELLFTHIDIQFIADKLNTLGYEFQAGDLTIVLDEKNNSIKEAIKVSETELESILEESRGYGLNPDINKQGRITYIVANRGSDTVQCCLVDGVIELVFTQNTAS